MNIGPAGFMSAPDQDQPERPAFGAAMIRCEKTRCKWRGKETDLVDGPKGRYGMTPRLCPNCRCDSYMFMTPKEIEAWERKQKEQPK